MTNEIVYSVVVPIFNEEEVLNELYKRLTTVMEKLDGKYEIIFVDDGSKDRSFQILKDLHQKNKKIKIIRFSRNFGHQIAITAGVDHALGKATIIIDADLQDPPELIPKLIEKWREGYEIVCAARKKREGESFFKRFTALLFYTLIRKISNIDILTEAGDFRLIDRKVVESLKNIRERNRFVRGLASWVGFKQTSIFYERKIRFAGETKYPLRKMVKFALDAIISFSYFPLRVATYLGFFISFLCLIDIIYITYLKIFTNKVLPGWSSLMITILFLGGVQLITIGIIGEYIGRIGEEVRNRPLYIVGEIIE